MFQLVVEKATETIESYDAKVSKTIEDIVEKFFQTVENSLIYICSDDDKNPDCVMTSLIDGAKILHIIML